MVYNFEAGTNLEAGCRHLFSDQQPTYELVQFSSGDNSLPVCQALFLEACGYSEVDIFSCVVAVNAAEVLAYIHTKGRRDVYLITACGIP